MHKIKKLLIVSLKYAPGLKKEYTLIGEKCNNQGIEVKYHVAEEYKWMFTEDFDPGAVLFMGRSDYFAIMKNVVQWPRGKIKQQILEYNPDCILFYNFHPLNLLISRLFKNKICPDGELKTYLHEPYMPDKLKYGLKKAIIIKTLEFIQGLIFKHQKHIIVPSKVAKAQFLEKYKSSLSVEPVIIPLMIPRSEISKDSILDSKQCQFIITGLDHPAKGFDDFFEIVRRSYDLKKQFKFCIITRSNIELRLKKLGPAANTLKVISKPNISDLEIDHEILKSYAVFKLDHAITQSGVVPVAFQLGTPIIARNIPGFAQNILDGKTGALVDDPINVNHTIMAMEKIILNNNAYRNNVRQEYKSVWCPSNWQRYYQDVLFSNQVR